MNLNTSQQQLREFGSALIAQTSLRPSRLSRYARQAAFQILDDQFDNSSPIPHLSGSTLALIQSTEVTMPPRSWFSSGNQSLDGLLFLVNLAKNLVARQAFEIGTYNGVTSWCLARNVPGLNVNTLDLPPKVATALPIEEGDQNHRRELPTRSYPLPEGSGTITQHWGDSATFDFSPWEGMCDLVYVDGAHSAPYVQSDSTNAFRLVSNHGAIVWDDYWRQVDGVRAVLDQLVQGELKGKLARIPGTRLVLYLSDTAACQIVNAGFS